MIIMIKWRFILIDFVTIIYFEMPVGKLRSIFLPILVKNINLFMPGLDAGIVDHTVLIHFSLLKFQVLLLYLFYTLLI